MYVVHFQVPSAVWSPFYLSLIENLVNRGGIVNFFHDHLRQAVENKYLKRPEDKTRGYRQLAEFFDKRELDGRKVGNKIGSAFNTDIIRYDHLKRSEYL